MLALADGSVFTGRQGLKNKLVDELGGEKEAIAWLESKDIDKDLEVLSVGSSDAIGKIPGFLGLEG